MSLEQKYTVKQMYLQLWFSKILIGVLYDLLFKILIISAESVSARLVKSLIPKASVPVIAVVKAISRICTNKLSIHFQVFIVFSLRSEV